MSTLWSTLVSHTVLVSHRSPISKRETRGGVVGNPGHPLFTTSRRVSLTHLYSSWSTFSVGVMAIVPVCHNPKHGLVHTHVPYVYVFFRKFLVATQWVPRVTVSETLIGPFLVKVQSKDDFSTLSTISTVGEVRVSLTPIKDSNRPRRRPNETNGPRQWS